MNTVAIIQARMGSTRLPGKVLKDLAGRPMLERVVERVLQANSIDQVVVATSRLPCDQPLQALCAEKDWGCFAGDEQDVLARYYAAARRFQADQIVRITADCPLVDPVVIDQVVETLTRYRQFDLVSNIWPTRTYPRGLDVEAFRMETLSTLYEKANLEAYREHVTLAAYREEGQFVIGSVERNRDFSHLRLTVDTPEDFELVKRIYNALSMDEQVATFRFEDVVDVISKNADWCQLNQHIQQKVA